MDSEKCATIHTDIYYHLIYLTGIFFLYNIKQADTHPLWVWLSIPTMGWEC